MIANIILDHVSSVSHASGYQGSRFNFSSSVWCGCVHPEDAAARELAEETGLQGVRLEQLGTFGKPGRDPRGRVITVVYTGIAKEGSESVKAADDAAAVKWCDVNHLPKMAFDHDEIARCAIENITRTGSF